jgi:hypothetical protein
MIDRQDIELLLNRARVSLTGASADELKMSLFDVLTEFFNDSSCWTEAVAFNAIAGTTLYNIAPTEGQIIRLAGVTDLNNLSVPALMPVVGQVMLAFDPNATVQYFATVVKNVVLPLTKDMYPIGPDWVLPLWHIGILDGLLGRMMAQLNKSYRHAVQSEYHLKRFRDVIARARVTKLRGNTHNTQAWRFPQGFATRSQQGGRSERQF